MPEYVLTVSALNRYVKAIIEEDINLKTVYVKGEISNFKHHYTGHMYFTLKDGNSLIKCIMFKTYTNNLNFIPKDGMNVLVLGTVSVFERDGIYQIYCKAMKEDGIGDLYARYEALKNKLETEGLFDERFKKKIQKALEPVASEAWEAVEKDYSFTAFSKTGTAEVGDRSHCWFATGLMDENMPSYVILTFLEYGEKTLNAKMVTSDVIDCITLKE